MGKTENLSISIRISSKWLWLLLFRENWWDEIIRLSSWKLSLKSDWHYSQKIYSTRTRRAKTSNFLDISPNFGCMREKLYWKIWLKLIKHPLLPFGLSKHLKGRNSKLCMSEWVTTIKACMCWNIHLQLMWVCFSHVL